MSIVRPMLAATIENISQLKFPLLATPKLDGIRAFMRNGCLLSRTAKLIPNVYIRKTLEAILPNGMDGELMVGDSWSACTSGIMSREGKPDFTYYIFDWYSPTFTYQERMNNLQMMRSLPNVKHLLPLTLNNLEELEHYEEKCLEAGYEGVILRSPTGPYKFGRSTMKEQYLMKLKRFKDAEAIVIGVEELERNTNPATTNELGLTQRSSHQSGKVGAGMLGKLVVRGTTGEFKDVEFSIGSGFTEEQRREYWKLVMVRCMGRTCKFKYFPIGCKDKPRHPIFLGWRKD